MMRYHHKEARQDDIVDAIAVKHLMHITLVGQQRFVYHHSVYTKALSSHQCVCIFSARHNQRYLNMLILSEITYYILAVCTATRYEYGYV